MRAVICRGQRGQRRACQSHRQYNLRTDPHDFDPYKEDRDECEHVTPHGRW
jgi:hypothetical protein